MLRKDSKIKITDILYALIICILFVLCYRLFYWMAIEYGGKYISDISYYVNIPKADNKERYRLIAMIFYIFYRISHNHSLVMMVVFLATMVVMIILTNYIYVRYLTKESCARRYEVQVASLVGPFMGSMYIPVIHAYFYKKSFASFSWHSPTEHLMIVGSTLTLLFFIKMYEKSEEEISTKYWILTMLSACFSSYAKPTFILNMITAMIAVFLIELFVSPKEERGKVFKRLFIMGCSLIPSGFFILLLIKSSFLGGDHAHRGGVAITFGNLLNTENLLLTVIAGLAFPIVVWTVNYKLIKTRRYVMPIGIFIMGLLQWAPFEETGARASHGNFEWGREIGCYYLFLTSLAIAINNWNDKETFMKDKPIARTIYFAVLALLLVWHVGSQIAYFYLVYKGTHFYI